MLVETVLYNTKVFFYGDLVEAGIAINDGKIVKIAKETNLPPASKKIDLNGNITLPGLIDSHVHLRDQQLSYKEDFVTGTEAAAAGGVTLVIDMPNNKPVTMDSFSLKERMKIAKNRILTNVAFNCAFPKKLDEINDVVKAGAVGFKVYLSSRIGGIGVDDDEKLLSAFHKVMENGVPVAAHAEDPIILEDRIKEAIRGGQNGFEAYVSAHPPEAEVQAIKRIIRLVKKSWVRIHFCHISTALGLDAVLLGKTLGLPLTCEITPHHLFLTSNQFNISGTFAITDPPLRTQIDNSALYSGLKCGSVDLIASDHAPHTFEEKKVDSVWEVKPGVPGLETTLPLLLNMVNNSRLSFKELVRLTAEEPAKIFHLNKRGCLDEGNWADLVVVDIKRKHIIDSSLFFSKAKYSPFDGMFVKGKPIKTFVNGTLVMDEGVIVSKPGIGQIVKNNSLLRS